MQQLPPQEPAFSSHRTCTSLPLQPLSTKKIALKYGLMFGAALVLRYLIGYSIIMVFIQSLPQLGYSANTFALLSLLLTAIFTLIDWVIYFLAGFFIVRCTRLVSASVIVCLWASFCYGVGYCVVTGINMIYTLSILTIDGSSWAGPLTSVGQDFTLTFLLLHLGLGTAIGALGGRMGKNATPPPTSTPP